MEYYFLQKLHIMLPVFTLLPHQAQKNPPFMTDFSLFSSILNEEFLHLNHISYFTYKYPSSCIFAYTSFASSAYPISLK